MEKNKDLFTKKFMFVLACFALIFDLFGIIYGIYTHDLGAVSVVLIIALPSTGSIYKGLTVFKK